MTPNVKRKESLKFVQKFADISIKTTTKVIKVILALPVTTVSSIQPLISTKCDTFGHIIHDDND